MYELIENGIQIFQLNEGLEKEDGPITTLSKEQIALAKFLPNMYYPAVRSDAPAEVKAAYKYLKDTYTGKHPYVKIYDENKQPMCRPSLIWGR